MRTRFVAILAAFQWVDGFEWGTSAICHAQP